MGIVWRLAVRFALMLLISIGFEVYFDANKVRSDDPPAGLGIFRVILFIAALRSPFLIWKRKPKAD